VRPPADGGGGGDGSVFNHRFHPIDNPLAADPDDPAGGGGDGGLAVRLTIPYVHAYYARLLVWPHPLSADYRSPMAGDAKQDQSRARVQTKLWPGRQHCSVSASASEGVRDGSVRVLARDRFASDSDLSAQTQIASPSPRLGSVCLRLIWAGPGRLLTLDSTASAYAVPLVRSLSDPRALAGPALYIATAAAAAAALRVSLRSGDHSALIAGSNPASRASIHSSILGHRLREGERVVEGEGEGEGERGATTPP
jgi:hypothetical protein